MSAMTLFTWPHLSLAIAVAMFAHWLSLTREGVLYARRTKKFEDEAARPLTTSPRVTVIVPARNEEHAIARCLDSLAAQDYTNFEVLAIDDRSTDRTGAVMDQASTRSHGRVRVVHVTALPEGWLGKNHANQVGVEAMAPETEYIVFTDGDVIFAPGTLSACVRHCEANAIDHFCLGPQMLSSGVWLATVQLVFGVAFLSILRPSRLGRAKDVYVGIGAFNMVRRRLYEKCGGHRRLRLEVIDDGMLGKILVQAGARADMVDGKRLIQLEWYHSVWGFVRGLEKNGFAALRYSYVRLAGFIAASLTIHFLPFAMIFLAPETQKPLFIALSVLHLVGYAVGAVMMGMSPLLTLLVPFSSVVIVFTFLRSTFYTIVRDGVSWRDTHYSLDELKRHMI